MKRLYLYVLVLGFMLGGWLPLVKGPFLCFAQENSFSSDFISMNFQDVSLKQILKEFSQQSGINFMVSEDIEDKKITLFFEKVTIQDALDTILAANGLMFEQKPNTNIFVVKTAKIPKIVLKTKIYKLSYATVSGADVGQSRNDASGNSDMFDYASSSGSQRSQGGGAEVFLKELLSENGKMIADFRTNSIMVTDTPAVLTNIENTLKDIDVKTPQVMISAEILEVSVDTLRRIGIEWGSDTGQFMEYTGGSRSTFWPFRESLFKDATETATVGTISFATFAGILKAIKTDSSTQYLARPRLLTLNNMPAQVMITKNAAVSSSTVTTATEGLSQATESLERYEVGTILKVTPYVNKDDYITMTVEPEVSRVRASTWNSSYYDPFKRSAKTTIMVKDGETVVIAGLISREDSDADRRVPILGDIPLLGRVFRRNEKKKSDTEVIIFITPHIIKEEGVALATALREELDLAQLYTEPKESDLLTGETRWLQQQSFFRKKAMRYASREFHRLVREQDSPFSDRELLVEKEVLRLKSAAMTHDKV